MPETDQLHPLAVENAELKRQRDEARGLLREISEEYFDDRADVDQPHGAEIPIPNEEMRWQTRIDEYLREEGD